MARKFFYVCAGMLMLVLSYHFGAASATAQGGPGVEAVEFDSNGMSVVANGTWFHVDPTTGEATRFIPLPVRHPIIATGSQLVVYKNGDFYTYFSGEWSFKGNLVHALNRAPTSQTNDR